MSEDSDAKIDAANAMLDELENKKREKRDGKESSDDDEDMEKSKLEKFGQREINNKE